MGLDKVISEAAEIPVRVADDPLTCVVRGTGILLENLDLLKNIALPSSQEHDLDRRSVMA
jgi:rod shape-determining protein MreB